MERDNIGTHSADREQSQSVDSTAAGSEDQKDGSYSAYCADSSGVIHAYQAKQLQSRIAPCMPNWNVYHACVALSESRPSRLRDARIGSRSLLSLLVCWCLRDVRRPLINGLLGRVSRAGAAATRGKRHASSATGARRLQRHLNNDV
jgi:hypothetical protein